MKFKSIVFIAFGIATFGAQGMWETTTKFVQKHPLAIGLIGGSAVAYGGYKLWVSYKSTVQNNLNQKLYKAIDNKNLNDVKKYVLEGADVNAKDNDGCLHGAVMHGGLEIVQFLIAHGAHVDAQNDIKRTPLHYAANFGHLKVIQYLINQGADVNAKDNAEWTPLHWAAYYGRLEIAQFLIAHGANINAQDYDGETPLHWVLSGGRSAIMVGYLVSQGANIYIQNNDGKTPLDSGNLVMPNVLQQIHDWNQQKNKAFALINPQSIYDDYIKSIIFCRVVNKGDIYSLFAIVNAVKDNKIQDEYFGPFSHLNQPEYLKILLVQTMQNPNTFMRLLDVGFGMYLSDKEVVSLRSMIKSLVDTKNNKYAIACYRLGWDLKKNLKQRIDDQKFADCVIKYGEN